MYNPDQKLLGQSYPNKPDQIWSDKAIKIYALTDLFISIFNFEALKWRFFCKFSNLPKTFSEICSSCHFHNLLHLSMEGINLSSCFMNELSQMWYCMVNFVSGGCRTQFYRETKSEGNYNVYIYIYIYIYKKQVQVSYGLMFNRTCLLENIYIYIHTYGSNADI